MKSPISWSLQDSGWASIPIRCKSQCCGAGRRGIVNCTRQWGKSTVAAAKAVHRAYCHPDSLILVLSPSARQSGEFVRKAEEFVSRLGDQSPGRRRKRNLARIVGLPHNEATVRGFSKVSLMLIDEAARVDDRMYRAMRPVLAVGNGDLWLIEHSQRQTRILSCGVDVRGREVAADQRDGGGMPVD